MQLVRPHVLPWTCPPLFHPCSSSLGRSGRMGSDVHPPRPRPVQVRSSAARSVLIFWPISTCTSQTTRRLRISLSLDLVISNSQVVPRLDQLHLPQFRRQSASFSNLETILHPPLDDSVPPSFLHVEDDPQLHRPTLRSVLASFRPVRSHLFLGVDPPVSRHFYSQRCPRILSRSPLST
jgi:hypothetical protein